MLYRDVKLALGPMKRAVIPIVAAVSLSGCFPYWAQITPQVTGTVVQNGVPVPSAQIFVIGWFLSEQCDQSPIETTSKADGRFLVDGTHKFEWLSMGDRLLSWGVCVRSNNSWYLGYMEVGMGFAPESVTLWCDLSTQPSTNRRLPPEERGVCHRVEASIGTHEQRS